jgi:XTP/dITP diphosphohydrolase
VKPKKTVLVLATTNEGKAREIRNALLDLSLKVITLADLGIRTPFPEKGPSFYENARGKSLFYSRRSGFLTLAEDSGLEVEALGEAPGVYSARFSGRRATDEKNIQKVLLLMQGVAEDNRRGRFVCCMVLSRNGKIVKTVRGQVRGMIAFDKKGNLGFGYDPIFFFKPLRKTFGELRPKEKNAVSHRGRALKKMKAFLEDYLKKGRPPSQGRGTARGGGRTL